MKREVKNVIDSAEDVGDNVYKAVLIIPDLVEDSIKLGKDIAVIPLVLVKDTTMYAAEKVDQTVDMVV